MSGDDWDELERRARESAESGGVPAGWGSKIDLDIGEMFRGRYRGHEEGGKSGAWLAWDADGGERYIWGCVSLDREFGRENPKIGDDIAISRAKNYRSQYDDADDDPSGLSYGVATQENKAEPPAGEDESGLPF